MSAAKSVSNWPALHVLEQVIEMQANYFEGPGGIQRRVGPVPPELVEKSEKVTQGGNQLSICLKNIRSVAIANIGVDRTNNEFPEVSMRWGSQTGVTRVILSRFSDRIGSDRSF